MDVSEGIAKALALHAPLMLRHHPIRITHFRQPPRSAYNRRWRHHRHMGMGYPENRVTADERLSRSFGLAADRCLAGIPIEEAFSSIYPDDRDRVLADIPNVMRRGGAYRCEYRVRQHEGGYRWVEANGRAELNSDDLAVRFPGALMDIESRRSAEAERDRMSALLRTFAAAVPGVVYAKDLEGRLLVANHGATQMIGKPPEFYLGKTDLDVLEDKTGPPDHENRSAHHAEREGHSD